MRRQLAIFLQGLVITVPLVVTVYILYSSFNWTDTAIRHLFRDMLPTFPGLGVIFACALIWLIGALSRIYLFSLLVQTADGLLQRVPLVKTLYGSVRDLLQFFNQTDRIVGEAVKLHVDDNTHMIGITTTEDEETGRVGVYLPLSYQIGGFLVYTPRDRLEKLPMGVEETLKMVLTGGMAKEHESVAAPLPTSDD